MCLFLLEKHTNLAGIFLDKIFSVKCIMYFLYVNCFTVDYDI